MYSGAWMSIYRARNSHSDAVERRRLGGDETVCDISNSTVGDWPGWGRGASWRCRLQRSVPQFASQTPHWSLSRLTHSHILCGDEPSTCGLLPTVKHILTECANLRDIRAKYFTVFFVRELFESVDKHTVIDFIKETHFLSPTVMFVISILY